MKSSSSDAACSCSGILEKASACRALAAQQDLRNLSVRECVDGLPALQKLRQHLDMVVLQLSSVIHSDEQHHYQAWSLQKVVFHAQAQSTPLLQTRLLQTAEQPFCTCCNRFLELTTM